MSATEDDTDLGDVRSSGGERGQGAPSPGFTRVQVLAKVRDIMDQFTIEQPELDLHELRQRSGLPPSTCTRLVQNMVADGLLDHCGGNRYRLGLAIVRWAAVAREGLGVTAVAAPELRALRDRVGETAGIFVRDGRSRVCVAVAEGTHVVGRRLTLGHVAPVHANAAGKALLAFDPDAWSLIEGTELERLTTRTKVSPSELAADLEATRIRGYAVSAGEWNSDVGGVAAPIRDAEGNAIAAVGVSVPLGRLNDDTIASLATAVVGAADRISVALGGFGAPTRIEHVDKVG